MKLDIMTIRNGKVVRDGEHVESVHQKYIESENARQELADRNVTMSRRVVILDIGLFAMGSFLLGALAFGRILGAW